MEIKMEEKTTYCLMNAELDTIINQYRRSQGIVMDAVKAAQEFNKSVSQLANVLKGK
jgi:hypothetical protein